MVTTRKSSQVEKENPLDPFGERKKQRLLGMYAIGIQRLGRGTQECFDLLAELFRHAKKSLWFRILPVDEHNDDISIGLGVDWRYLLPLLTKVGLIRSKVTSVVKDVYVDIGQWHEMSRAITQTVKMEVTAVRTKYSRRSYFFCVGNPIFQNPLHQAKGCPRAISSALEQSELPPRNLVSEVTKAASQILDERLTIRVLQGGNENLIDNNMAQPAAAVLNNEQIEEVAATVYAAINFAAALDLDRLPRLSRSNASKYESVLF